MIPGQHPGTLKKPQLPAGTWSDLNRSTRRHLWLLRPHFSLQPQLVQDWLKDLVHLGDPASLDLAVELSLLIRELPEQQSRFLNEKLASVLAKSESFSPEQAVLVNGLFHTDGTVVEARLYSNATWFAAVSLEVPHFLTRVAERIPMMARSVPQADYVKLSSCLKSLLDRSKGYPVEVSASALNALIQIDVASREPVKEELWQIAGTK